MSAANRSICVEALQYVDHLPYRSGMHRLLMIELAMFCNRDTLEIFPAQKTLAQKLMVSDRHIRNLTDDLIEDKLLCVYTRGKDGRGGRDKNGYEIVGLSQFIAGQREAALNAWEEGKAELDFRFDQAEQSGTGVPVQSGTGVPTNNKGEYKRKGSNRRGRVNGYAYGKSASTGHHAVKTAERTNSSAQGRRVH